MEKDKLISIRTPIPFLHHKMTILVKKEFPKFRLAIFVAPDAEVSLFLLNLRLCKESIGQYEKNKVIQFFRKSSTVRNVPALHVSQF